MNPYPRFAWLFVLMCVAGIVPAGDASAATYTWVGTSGVDNWFYFPASNLELNANWNSPGSTLTTGDSLVFGAVGSGASVTPFQSANNDTAPISSLTFVSGAPAYTLVGSVLFFNDGGALINLSSTLQTVNTEIEKTNPTGAPLIVDTGAAGLVAKINLGDFVKKGSGVLTFDGHNFGETMTLEAGAVEVKGFGIPPFMFGGNVIQIAGTFTGTGSTPVDMVGSYSLSGGSGFISKAVVINQTGGTIALSSGAQIGFPDFFPPTIAPSTLSGVNSVSGTVGSTVTFGAGLVLGGSNSTTLDVAGPGVADRYIVTGTGGGTGLLTYGGTLNINFTSGSQANGTTWSLFDPLTVSGTLAAITGTGQAPYASLAWGLAATSANYYDQKYGAGIWLSDWTASGQRLIFSQATGDITVVPEPSTFVMAAAGIGGYSLLRWRRGRRRASEASESKGLPIDP